MHEFTFSIPEEAAQLPISVVELVLTMPASGRASQHSFNMKDGARSWTIETPERASSYRYRVVFEDGDAPIFESAICTTDSLKQITIVDFGVRIFLTSSIDFIVVRQIDVSYLSLDGIRSFILNAAHRFHFLFAGIDYPKGAPLSYGLEYKIADGNYRRSDLSAPASFVDVPYPFVEKTTTILSVGITGSNPTVRNIQLKVSTSETGHDWKIVTPSRQELLDDSKSTYARTYQTVDPNRALMQYSGSIVYLNGRIKGINPTECKLTVIPIGDTEPYNSITIISDRVHWNLYRRVTLQLGTKNTSENEQFLFTADSLSEYWGYFAAKPSYFWSAEYEQNDGKIVLIPRQEAYAPVLTLPSQAGGLL